MYHLSTQLGLALLYHSPGFTCTRLELSEKYRLSSNFVGLKDVDLELTGIQGIRINQQNYRLVQNQTEYQLCLNNEAVDLPVLDPFLLTLPLGYEANEILILTAAVLYYSPGQGASVKTIQTMLFQLFKEFGQTGQRKFSFIRQVLRNYKDSVLIQGQSFKFDFQHQTFCHLVVSENDFSNQELVLHIKPGVLTLVESVMSLQEARSKDKRVDADENHVNGNISNGNHVNGNLENGNQVHGNISNGNHVNGNLENGNKVNGNHVNGNRANESSANGNHTNDKANDKKQAKESSRKKRESKPQSQELINYMTVLVATVLWFRSEHSCSMNFLAEKVHDFESAWYQFIKVKGTLLPKKRLFSYLQDNVRPVTMADGSCWTIEKKKSKTDSTLFLKSFTGQDALPFDYLPKLGKFVNVIQEAIQEKADMDDFKRLKPESIPSIDAGLMGIYQTFDLMPDRQEVVAKIQSILDAQYPNFGSVLLFGSSANNLGTAHADVDMCIRPHCDLGQQPHHPLMDMYKLAKVLASGRNKIKEVIRHARVPIVKFIAPTSGGIQVDINLGHTLGFYNSQLLRAYTLLDPRVKPLIMLVKFWSKKRCLNDAPLGTFSSYALTLMVLGFLQHCGLLENLQADCPQPEIIRVPQIQTRHAPKTKSMPMREIDVTFRRGKPQSAPVWTGDKSVGQLFYEFMFYFAFQYPYDNKTAISIRQGGITQKTDFNHSLIVEDPFELDRNCTSNIDHLLPTIINEFRRAIKYLEQGDLQSLFEENSNLALTLLVRRICK